MNRRKNMPRLSVKIEKGKTTVSDMRKELARVLSKLPGDSEVESFHFDTILLNYKPSKGPICRCYQCNSNATDMNAPHDYTTREG
jgi:hypothetical protein